ncbi:type II toxin-antitoxin system death-on-curing family toxin [Bacillus sp. AFS002410]|uniref:type II toxin-antitoxin system death-on-curing family toxin n=1 Tax=Bacillus sp. AFS002410 TaxID=2033481 RepID=UPI000BEFA3B2|nr:type II toxin-antitoxin system death-on-curing family toxin [Bacillus sp. AFS002410]PEJ53314.1 type II toxin-antitoxin system death-on-curing family toxin [Bacillus sp. AFS002410]
MSVAIYKYLDVAEVEELHDYALRDYGGIPGRDIGRLESVLALPSSGFDGYERFPTLHEKAAVYMFYIATGHCFKDGNKRTAFLAASVFIMINGYDLIVDNNTVVNFMIIRQKTPSSIM